MGDFLASSIFVLYSGNVTFLQSKTASDKHTKVLE